MQLSGQKGVFGVKALFASIFVIKHMLAIITFDVQKQKYNIPFFMCSSPGAKAFICWCKYFGAFSGQKCAFGANYC